VCVCACACVCTRRAHARLCWSLFDFFISGDCRPHTPAFSSLSLGGPLWKRAATNNNPIVESSFRFLTRPPLRSRPCFGSISFFIVLFNLKGFGFTPTSLVVCFCSDNGQHFPPSMMTEIKRKGSCERCRYMCNGA